MHLHLCRRKRGTHQKSQFNENNASYVNLFLICLPIVQKHVLRILLFLRIRLLTWFLLNIFLYYRTSWNKKLFAIFVLFFFIFWFIYFFLFFSKRKDKISSFDFVKTLMFYLMYFSSQWNIPDIMVFCNFSEKYKSADVNFA